MPSISDSLKLAMEHQQGGNLDRAAQIYRDVLAVSPNHPDALHLLGLLAYQIGKCDAAVELLRQAISVHPNGIFYQNLGNILSGMHRLDDAIGAFQTATQFDPRNGAVYAALLPSLAKTGDRKGVLEAARRFSAADPGNAEAQFLLAAAHYFHGEKSTANELLCGLLDGLDPVTRNTLGQALGGDESSVDVLDPCLQQPRWTIHGLFDRLRWRVLRMIEASLGDRRPSVALVHITGSSRGDIFYDSMKEFCRLADRYAMVMLLLSEKRRDDLDELRVPCFYIDGQILPKLDFVDMMLLDDCGPGPVLPDSVKIVLINHGSFPVATHQTFFFGNMTSYFDFVLSSSRSYSRTMADGIRKFRTACEAEMEQTGAPQIHAQSAVPARSWKRRTHVVPLGSPKTDPYFSGGPVAAPQCKCLVFAPTATSVLPPEYASCLRAAQIIERLLNELPDYRIVFRPFPLDRDHEITRETVARFHERANFVADLDGGPTRDLYRNSTVFLTDGSSGGFSFMAATRRPAVFLLPEVPSDTLPYINAFAEACEQVGVRVTSVEQLVPAVRDIERQPGKFRARIDRFIETELYHPGKARQRMYDEIESMLGDSSRSDWILV